MNPQPKPKKRNKDFKQCKVCGVDFKPSRPLQRVCGIECSIVEAKEKEKKKQDKEWNIQKRERKKNLETLSDVKKKLQVEINAVCRVLDKGHNCISCGNDLGEKYDSGHFYSSGGHPSITFNLLNIWGQCVYCNQHLSGNPIGYLEGIELIYGEEIKYNLIELKNRPLLKLSKDEVREYTQKAKSVLKRLKELDKKFTNSERLELREKINNELGIY